MVATPGPGAAEQATALDEVAGSLMSVWSRAHNAPDVPVPATQLRALLALEHGPMNVSELAAELGALVSSASRLCDRLEASGLLLRDAGRDDRREVTVQLTAEGRGLLERLQVRRRAELARVLADMSSPARQALLWGLLQFQEAVTASPGEPGEPDDSMSLPA
ncbi:MarR family transcriptional regulator [Actinomadura parmotrematis]|uniref:MarR family transcriptional regulator n=1 Tax=Actinomadura parmotrematis TaxID=2864039 RepID=A0ABS7FNS0_9ACTN|nr:MarR family transcriptional regulator [Actinomadura parmotrematis]MBW8482023.1 MarR family transcriptional regulator [Actinomadura parmotrematis]